MSTYLKESSEALRELFEESTAREHKRLTTLLKEADSKVQEVMDLKEHHEFVRDRKRNYKLSILETCLSDALKGIYISALLKENQLEPENIKLAESMVDNFIKEEGGALTVLRRMDAKTYLLDTVKKIVEDTADEVEQTASEDEKDFDEVPEENKEEMLDKMEKEDDIEAAIDIISQRVADAEQQFIQKNAEDKEKLNAIAQDLNDRIESIKADNETSEETKEELEQEATLIYKRKANDIKYGRKRNVFEHCVSCLTETVVKDKELLEAYSEEGKVDMGRIINQAKCIYGFLEFVNSTQLVKVDEDYIKGVIESM